jgi:hypothetical protein
VDRSTRIAVALAVVALVAVGYHRFVRTSSSPDMSRLVNRGTATPGAGVPAAGGPSPGAQPSPPAAQTQSSDEPELDRELSAAYKKALETQGLKILGLAITDRRSTGGARRADILYRTTTDGRLVSLRPEIVRIVSPGANPKLALDTITVRAALPSGRIAATVAVTVPEVDRWLKSQMSDQEFYGRWVVTTPPR